MAIEAIRHLLALTLVSSVVIALVLLVRRPVRLAFGAAVTYRIWLLVPIPLVAMLLPVWGQGASSESSLRMCRWIRCIRWSSVRMSVPLETGTSVNAYAWLLGSMGHRRGALFRLVSRLRSAPMCAPGSEKLLEDHDTLRSAKALQAAPRCSALLFRGSCCSNDFEASLHRAGTGTGSGARECASRAARHVVERTGGAGSPRVLVQPSSSRFGGLHARGSGTRLRCHGNQPPSRFAPHVCGRDTQDRTGRRGAAGQLPLALFPSSYGETHHAQDPTPQPRASCDRRRDLCDLLGRRCIRRLGVRADAHPAPSAATDAVRVLRAPNGFLRFGPLAEIQVAASTASTEPNGEQILEGDVWVKVRPPAGPQRVVR